METINLAEQKLLLFQKIMTIENDKVINKRFIIVDKFISSKSAKNIEDLENIDIENLTFEEWNELFMEDKDLNQFIPEYDMTLGEYRNRQYNAEKGKSYPINQFLEKLENSI